MNEMGNVPLSKQNLQYFNMCVCGGEIATSVIREILVFFSSDHCVKYCPWDRKFTLMLK